MYENNKRVYKIPFAGILKTQFDADYGWTEFPEFYYEEIKKNRKIPLVTKSENYSQDKINATLLSTGKSYRSNTDAVEYSKFFIGTKSQIKKASNELDKLHIADLINDE